MAIVYWFSFVVLAQNTEEPLVKKPLSETLLQEDSGRRPAAEAPDTVTDLGIPYSRVLRDVQPPYEGLFRNFKLAGETETKLGEAAGQFHVDFIRGLQFDTPLSAGIRPETSEIKLGNFYLDVQSLAGSLFISDNIDLSETNREADVLAMIQLRLGAMYELGENLRIGIRGSLIYLPLSGDIGVAGFGINDFFGELSVEPLVQARIAYDLHISHWELELIDNFTVQYRWFRDNFDYQVFEGVTFEEQEANGRFRVATTPTLAPKGRRSRERRALVEARNQLGGILTRMLPTETRFETGAFHQNHWYYNKQNQNLPNTSDYAFANLINERPEMRFKPFLHYKTRTADTQDGWDHRVTGGFHGPVTDYIDFLGDVGQIWLSSGQSSLLWRLRLDHNPTPLLSHQIQYRRWVTEPDRDLEEAISYRLRYKVNPNIYSEFMASRTRFEDLDQTGTGDTEWRVGGRLTFKNIIQRTTLQISQFYTDVDSDDPAQADVTLWTTRVDIRINHTETLDSHLVYRFQVRDSSLPFDSYYENLLVYTLTKYF